MKSKEEYLLDFANLKRNHQFQRPAPQKSIYYLSIIDAITCGFITTNKFSFIPQLKSKFIDYWNAFVGDEKPTKPTSLSLRFTVTETRSIGLSLILTK